MIARGTPTTLRPARDLGGPRTIADPLERRSCERCPYADGARLQVEIASGQRRDLTPAQACERGQQHHGAEALIVVEVRAAVVGHLSTALARPLPACRRPPGRYA